MNTRIAGLDTTDAGRILAGQAEVGLPGENQRAMHSGATCRWRVPDIELVRDGRTEQSKISAILVHRRCSSA